MAGNIIGGDKCSNAFVAQWIDSSDYIDAHTSGSTGTPKPIRLLKSDMRISARNTCEFFRLDSQSTLVLPLSSDYIAGKMMIVRALECGGTLIIEQPSNNPLPTCRMATIDLIAIVPSQIDGLLKSTQFHKIKNVIIGGGRIPESMEHKLENVSSANIYATYGMTETCSHVALRRIGDKRYHALPGFTFDIDERGCLIIKTEEMSFGQLTTNDLVELENNHSFRWLGRYDNIINSGGIKLVPEQIETKIAPLVCGHNFYVTSRKSDKWGDELGLIIECDTEIPHLNRRLSDILTSVERPKFIAYEPNFQRTSSGKIIRKKW